MDDICDINDVEDLIMVNQMRRRRARPDFLVDITDLCLYSCSLTFFSKLAICSLYFIIKIILLVSVRRWITFYVNKILLSSSMSE